MRVDVQYAGESWGEELRQYMYYIINCLHTCIHVHVHDTCMYMRICTCNFLLNVDEGAKEDQERVRRGGGR